LAIHPILFGTAVKRSIKIVIAGQQYMVRSDADEGYVQKLAALVNSRVRMLLGNRQIATQAELALTALQLADELTQERQQQTRLRGQVRQKTQRMLDYLTTLQAPPATK
jgi:cell division protein ZapA (FtsZ GTPase activity inhibitor)